MLLPDESPALSSCSSSSTSALLQVLFHPSTTVKQDGGTTVAITSLSNGTTIDSLHFRKGDQIANVSFCLSRTGCYGLVLVDAWKSYNYTIVFDGSHVNGDDAQEFPYYMTPHAVGSSSARNSSGGDGNMDDDDDDNLLFTPYESNLTFLEIGDRSSCVPSCDPSKGLYEVQTFAGNQGDGSFGWRLEQDEQVENPTGGSQVRALMGCGASEDAAGAGSSESCGGGGAYRVRITRACLPKSPPPGCRRFVIGHPNSFLAEPGLGTPYPGGKMNDTTIDMAGSEWVGHYHPMFKVSVNGAVVANGTSTTFAAVEIGGNLCPSTSSSSCPANESLLELFQYGMLRVDYVLRDLTSGRAVSHSGNNNNSSASDAWTPLRYVRQVVSSKSGCYDLSISAATSVAGAPHNNSGDDDGGDDDGISTQAVLDGVYYTNALVRYLPFHVLLGDRCLRQQACPLAGESLIRIDINMSGLVPSRYIPSYYCAWSVFRADSDPPESVMPEESMSYFSNGYPGGNQFRHYMCVPDDDGPQAGGLTFVMLHSVPMEVEWSVTRDGVPLECRAALAGGRYESSTPTTTFDSTFSGYVVTPLDGSCPPNATTGPDSTSPSSPVLATGLFVGIVGGILAAVAMMAAAIVASRSAALGAAEESSNVRRRGSPWPSSLGGARRRRSIRSTGTEPMSVTEYDDPSVGDECAREP